MTTYAEGSSEGFAGWKGNSMSREDRCWLPFSVLDAYLPVTYMCWKEDECILEKVFIFKEKTVSEL